MERFGRDLRFALRLLAKSPGFTLIAALILAVGIAAVTNLFSFVNALVLRPYPFPDLDRIADVRETVRAYPDQDFGLSAADFRDWSEHAKGFERLATFRHWGANLTGAGVAERVVGNQVTADFFPLLGIPSRLGRSISALDFEPGHSSVVVLSHGFWKRHLGADPAIIGRNVFLNGQPFVVIGVMPAEMNYPPGTDLWTPLDFSPAEREDRSNLELRVLGRLKPGVSARQAEADLETIAARLEREYPQTNRGHGAKVVGMVDELTRGTGPELLLVVGGAAAFLLLLACANVANLQLARATSRQKEIVMRRALGANRWHIASQLLVESVLVALLGGLAGLAFAGWGFSLLRRTFPPLMTQFVPGGNHIEVDSKVVAFAALATLATGILAGLSPALHLSRTNLQDALRESGRGVASSATSRRLRAMLVIAEVALALVLLVGAGLMIRGFGRLIGENPGFDRHNVLTFSVALSESQYRDDQRVRNFYDQALEKLRRLPGVESAAIVTSLPADWGWYMDWETYRAEGQPPLAPGEGGRDCLVQDISPDYFRTLHLPMLKGRAFAGGDAPGAPRVAIISQNLARRLWPGQEALGRRIRLESDPSNQPWRTVVGVAGITKTFPLDEDPGPIIYLPAAQSPGRMSGFVMRTRGDPSALTASARAAMVSVDPDQPAYDIRSMEQRFEENAFGLRYAAKMMVGFGGVALALAAAGIFAVMAYSVAQRTHEIGVRMALGAPRANVVALVLGDALKLTTIGLVLGVVSAWALTRALGSVLFGIFRLDAATFVGFAGLLLIVAALSAYFPARRATKVDPIVALRYE